MFRKSTVLVLGAGASWHYNYPTGEELVSEIRGVAKGILNDLNPILRTRKIESIIRISFGGPVSFRDQLNQLIVKLMQMQPLVIDYFLGQNPEIAKLAKVIIAYIILHRERQYLRSHKNFNRKNGEGLDDWVRFVTHGLMDEFATPEDLIKNKITFITFNYDVSLERRLFESLSAVESIRVKNLADAFLSQDRIIHMYGKVREDYHRAAPEFVSPEEDFVDILHHAFSAAEGIRTIAPLEKRLDEVVSTAQEAIVKAQYIYFLGYGFDRNNNQLLGLPQISRQDNKQIYFTNFQNKNKVGKTACVDLGISATALLGENYIERQTYSSPTYHVLNVEKSIRNVYDALALDFDWPT